MSKKLQITKNVADVASTILEKVPPTTENDVDFLTDINNLLYAVD